MSCKCSLGQYSRPPLYMCTAPASALVSTADHLGICVLPQHQPWSVRPTTFVYVYCPSISLGQYGRPPLYMCTAPASALVSTADHLCICVLPQHQPWSVRPTTFVYVYCPSISLGQYSRPPLYMCTAPASALVSTADHLCICVLPQHQPCSSQPL